MRFFRPIRQLGRPSHWCRLFLLWMLFARREPFLYDATPSHKRRRNATPERLPHHCLNLFDLRRADVSQSTSDDLTEQEKHVRWMETLELQLFVDLRQEKPRVETPLEAKAYVLEQRHILKEDLPWPVVCRCKKVALSCERAPGSHLQWW